MRGEKAQARWVLLLLSAKGMEAAGELLVQVWKRSGRRGRLDHALRALEANGAVGRSGSGPLDERLFRLTAAGRNAALGTLDPEALWAREWDGKWRLVLFDVPQSRAAVRMRLRRALQRLRFGWLQNSVWLSPDPLEDLTRELAAERSSVESLILLEGRPAGGESDAELVAGAWDFARIGKAHSAYQKVLQLRPAPARRTAVEDWLSWLEAEARAWSEVLMLDPFLPERLLPADYAGQAVWRARREALHAAGQALARSVERG